MNHRSRRTLAATVAGAAAVAAIAVAGATNTPMQTIATDATRATIEQRTGEHVRAVTCAPDTRAGVVPCVVTFATGPTLATHYRPADGAVGVGHPAVTS